VAADARVLPGSRRRRLEPGTPDIKARSRRSRFRAFLLGILGKFGRFGIAVLVAVPALSGEGTEADRNCDGLPEAQRPMCLMVQACATLPDEKSRRECFRAAADGFTQSEPGQPQQPKVAEDRQPERDAERQPPRQMRTAAESEDEPRMADSEPQRAERERSAGTESGADRQRTGTLGAVRRLFSRSSAPAGPEIPKRFTAQVTAHRDLVRDRQLLVLDDKLLFEGDNAASSAIQVGDEVNVVKSSSLRGRRYQISGPSKRRFEALRIRCERTDLNVDNRRKCDGMMGDSAL